MPPLITEEKCARLCKIIQTLMDDGREDLATKLLKAFAFDPVVIMEDLERLEMLMKKDEPSAQKLISVWSHRDMNPPPL